MRHGISLLVVLALLSALPSPAALGEIQADAEAMDITELNDEIRACLHNYHFGGTALYAKNCHDAEQVLRLVTDNS